MTPLGHAANQAFARGPAVLTRQKGDLVTGFPCQ